MILFVFEGAKVEPRIFESIERLYFDSEEIRVVKFGSDLPTLYKSLKRNEEDLLRSLPLEQNGLHIPEGKRLDTLFSQVFLFFDYDFQHNMGLTPLNDILREMLDFFDDETGNGKLYINYPMVESLKYTRELPDENYWTYEVTRQMCVNHNFKKKSERFAFSGARGFRFINIKHNTDEKLANTWELLRIQNVRKANYVVSNNNSIPENKSIVSQKAIFDAQIDKYVITRESVAVLNSFPLFLYEYFK